MGERDQRAQRGSDRPVVAWAPSLIWAALIFVLSAQPDLRLLPDQNVDFIVRNIGHMGAFGILALLFWRALATTARPRPWVAASVITVVYAITDELHQAGVIGRYASAVDVAIDAAGALVAVAAGGLVQAVRARRDASA